MVKMLKEQFNKNTDIDHELSNIPAVLQDTVDRATDETHRLLLPMATVYGSSVPLTRARFEKLKAVVNSHALNGTELSTEDLAEAKAFASRAVDCETHVEAILKRKSTMAMWTSGYNGYANHDDGVLMSIVKFYHQRALDNRTAMTKTNKTGQKIEGNGRYATGLPTFVNLDPAQVAQYICEAYELCGPILKHALRTRMPKNSTLKSTTASMSGWDILHHLHQRSDDADAHTAEMVIASFCSLLNCPPGIGPVAAADASTLTIEKLLREHPEVGNMSALQMLKLMSLIGLLTKCVAEAGNNKTAVATIAAELKKQDFCNPDHAAFARHVAKDAKDLEWINKISAGTESSTRASANHANHTDQKQQEPAEHKTWSLVASNGKHKAQIAAQDDGGERRRQDDGNERRRQQYLRNMGAQLKRAPPPSAAEAHAEASKNVYNKIIPWKRYEKSNMRARTWTAEMMDHPWRKTKTSTNPSDRNDSMKATTARISKLEDAAKGIEQNVQAMLAMMQAAHQ